MKLSTLILLFLIIGCNLNPKVKSTKNTDYTKTIKNETKPMQDGKDITEPASWDTIVLGDINNDKISDTAFIYTPPVLKHVNNENELQFYLDCVEGYCYNLIHFSCKIPTFKIENSVWGSIENIGDLNDDGFSELIFSPNWFTSCWGNLYIYSFDGKQWKRISEVEYYNCAEESLKSHVKKINDKYYLKGLKIVDGDDKEYKVEIKIK